MGSDGLKKQSRAEQSKAVDMWEYVVVVETRLR